jgi:hypothetical protein
LFEEACGLGPGPQIESYCSKDDRFALKISERKRKKLQEKARAIARENEVMQEVLDKVSVGP